MAIPIVKIENPRGQVLDFSTDSRYVAILTGTGPPPATVNRSKASTTDGTQYNSATVGERPLLLTIHLIKDVARARLNLYKYIATKQYIKVYYQNDGLDVYVEGYIETVEVDPWAASQTVQASIICPMPFWRDVKETHTDASSVQALFELPFFTDATAYITATGKIINIQNAPAEPFSGLKIYGKTVQNGTPTPESPVPLESVGASGAIHTTVGGKNLYSGGDVVVSSAYVGYQIIQFPVYAGYPQFTVSFNPNGFTGQLACLAMNGKYFTLNGTESRATMVITPDKTNATGMLFYNATAANASINFTDIQIEFGNTATAYEPYKGQTLTASTPNGLPGIPVSSGGNYTDSDGQQRICDEIDFARGVYVQRIYSCTLSGNEQWETMTVSSGVKLFRTAVYQVGAIIPKSGKSSVGYIKYQDMDNGAYGLTYAYGFRVRFADMNPDSNTLDEFRAYLAENPISALVVLATPIETPLSAQELAAFAALHTNDCSTVIYNDAGADMEVKYLLNRGDGMELSVVESNSSTVIENQGTVEAGVTFVVKATVQSTNPRIYNLSTGEFIGVLCTLEPGDRLEISTATGSKRVAHIRDGVRSNCINAVMEGSKWLQMAIGANEYSYTVDEGECELAVYHTNMYTGV